MSETEEAAKRLREIGAISANWAMTDEAEIRRTCRKAADCIERQTERVKALTEALRGMGFGGQFVDEKIGWMGTYPHPKTDHFKCEFCFAEHLDCTLIAHSSECPVTLARAALSQGAEG